jgi:hypothetical protein
VPRQQDELDRQRRFRDRSPIRTRRRSRYRTPPRIELPTAIGTSEQIVIRGGLILLKRGGGIVPFGEKANWRGNQQSNWRANQQRRNWQENQGRFQEANQELKWQGPQAKNVCFMWLKQQ